MNLFNRFIHRFSASGTGLSQNMSEHSSVTAEQTINASIIEQFNRYNPLMTLQDSRQLLEVFVPDIKNSFQSMIVGIDFIKQQLDRDECLPALSNPEALVGKTLIVRHQLKQQMLCMSLEVIDWDSMNHYYHLSLPASVKYTPRRHSDRLLLAYHKVLNVHITPLYGSPWHATVKDISHGGMRIAMAGDTRPHLHKHKALPKCQIILSNNITIQCRGEVKAFSYQNKPYRHTSISIEFDGMNDEDRQHLQHFIDYIEIAA